MNSFLLEINAYTRLIALGAIGLLILSVAIALRHAKRNQEEMRSY